MKFLQTRERVEVPAGVTVTVKSRIVTVEGPLGKVEKAFKHAPVNVQLIKEGDKTFVEVEMWLGGYKKKSCVKTIHGLIKNMINGVTHGYRYKLRMVAAHFPIKCEIARDGRVVTFKNIFGGKQDKTVKLLAGCSIKLDAEVKDQIIIDGVDNANVSQSAALISQCVKVGKKDHRKFLDGIYVSGKCFQDDEGEQ